MNQFAMKICDQMITATSDQDVVTAQNIGDMNYQNNKSMAVDTGKNLIATADMGLALSSQYGRTDSTLYPFTFK